MDHDPRAFPWDVAQVADAITAFTEASAETE
jgi:hypothetical protein